LITLRFSSASKSDMLDRELRAEFESYRKTLGSEEARRGFDERIDRLLNQHGVDYVRGYGGRSQGSVTIP
jgi:hypothetical protein